MAEQRLQPRPRPAVVAALAVLAAAATIAATASSEHVLDALTFGLIGCAVGSILTLATLEARIEISGTFVCYTLAAAFLGPLPAFIVVVVSELAAWPVQRYRLISLPINIATAALPVVVAAVTFEALIGGRMHDGSIGEIGALALAGTLYLALNFVLLHALVALRDGSRLLDMLAAPRAIVPSLVLTLALTLAIAGVYARYGLSAGIFVILVLVAFTYMSRLVVLARERTQQYASLSWGVLSALVRSLDRRDGRTARHSAAVAAFARDIAVHAGLDKRQAELAHTAGLLHDIGRFALPDRVMERSGSLTDDDWTAIQRHPELGAEMLADLGVYGPVAEIVRAHHERLDGRGYPDGLKGEDIPEIARIVAVAEVYDTLTAEDTYRERMTSFQALTEMRRVAGRQLDGRFVEALAELLAGRDLDYRHADRADFDAELAIQRRIADAVSPDPAAGREPEPAPAPPPATADEQA